MYEQNPTRDPSAEAAQVDRAIVVSLLAEPLSWPVHEVGCEIGDPTAAEDSLRRLYATGFVNYAVEYVWPTRAARYAIEIA